MSVAGGGEEASNAPVDFSLLETHKENISSLPSGRSAKALAALYTPPLTSRPSPVPGVNTPEIAAFEAEITTLDEADDPLDVYVRYATHLLAVSPDPAAPASGLRAVLERGTKQFLHEERYKNDARYLKLWLRYISLFSESPREVYVYLARNGVGQELALFYEEYAGWLEGQGRWGQAAEVYELGVNRAAKPAERLARRRGEFEARRERAGEGKSRAESPALPPLVRAVLGERVDPYAVREQGQADKAEKKGKRTKMAIFSDDVSEKESVLGSGDGNWDLGTAKSRKKENEKEASAWVGQTLKVGKTNTGMGKMDIFRNVKQRPSRCRSTHEAQHTKNPRTGRTEAAFVNLDVVYTDLGQAKVEFSFEEVIARHRGWLEMDWKAENRRRAEEAVRQRMPPPEKKVKKKGFEIFSDGSAPSPKPQPSALPAVQEQIPLSIPVRTVILNDENNEHGLTVASRDKSDEVARRTRKEERANRTRKLKVMEVRHEKKETQTVQLNLASPTGPKIRRKKTAEATMTINTKEAMDEIYGMFNQPAQTDKPETEEEEEEEEEDSDDDDDDNYTSGGESTTTGRISAPTSEYGEETRNEILQAHGVEDTRDIVDTQDEAETTDADTKTDATGWSDFTASRHVPQDALQADSHDHVEEESVTPSDGSSPPETMYVSLPPIDYEAPSATYRSRAVMANNRLPFMTPIAEQTESSIGTSRTDKDKDYFTSKTPSRQTHLAQPILEDDDEAWSSPFQEQILEAAKGKSALLDKVRATSHVAMLEDEMVIRGPVIPDKQVNPCEPAIRDIILAQVQPGLSTYPGFHDHRDDNYGRVAEIKKFAKAISKKGNGADKTGTTLSLPPSLTFPGSRNVYTIKRELGCGSFGPVYLVERELQPSDDPVDGDPSRGTLKAMKLEYHPPSAWEFYMISETRRRLAASCPRVLSSIIACHELHLYRDASFLVESYADNGTLLDLVNLSRTVDGCNGGSGAGLDESLAMFYTVELLRAIEALHAQGLIHGDLKADNIMLRLPKSNNNNNNNNNPSSGRWWSPTYQPNGDDGWSDHGLTLIDFGRAIDTSHFRPDVGFVADWQTTDADCVEMRELRTWTWQIDYHGLAGTVHTLLYGRYMQVVQDRCGALGVGGGGGGGGGGGERVIASEPRRWKIRDSLKRYWKTELWNELFALLLNSGGGGNNNNNNNNNINNKERKPLVADMARVRAGMEAHLRGLGPTLQEKLRRLEDASVCARRKR